MHFTPARSLFLVASALTGAAFVVGFSYFHSLRAADPASATVAVTEPAEPVPAGPASISKFPNFNDILGDGEFAILKSKSSKLATIASAEIPPISPPSPPPLATVAAAEAKAPPDPSPCEIAVRRHAYTTKPPVRETILDDVEAKYEFIRMNSNQRFAAIRSACVKGHPPKRGG